MEALSHNAQRQYMDAVSAFTALEEAQQEAEQVRGGMYWHKGPRSNPEAHYLVRTTAAGGETSLGARSAETEAIYANFQRRKQEAEERLTGLKVRVSEHKRLNKALRVGRVDPLVINLLNRLASTKLAEHFRVVGTHAVYAYEAEAGLRVIPGAVATQDIDFLWDVRKRVHFASQLKRIDSSMLGVLKTVDPSFRVRRSQQYTAVNQDGFEVDIIRRQPVDGDAHPIRLSDDEGDLWAAQAVNAHVLMDSPAFSAVIVASNGEMARMNTLHPLAFARFKRWMSALPNRDAKKKARDLLQAQIVEEIVSNHLPHLAHGDNGFEIPALSAQALLAPAVSTGLPEEEPAVKATPAGPSVPLRRTRRPK
jgi:hypothetical protein